MKVVPRWKLSSAKSAIILVTYHIIKSYLG